MSGGCVCYCEYELGHPLNDESNDIYFDIYRSVFHSIIEAMQGENPDDSDWVGFLEGDRAIKGLYLFKHPIIDEEGNSNTDYGPAFLRALRLVRENDPPSYHAKKDYDKFYQEIDLLEEGYLIFRPETEQK